MSDNVNRNEPKRRKPYAAPVLLLFGSLTVPLLMALPTQGAFDNAPNAPPGMNKT